MTAADLAHIETAVYRFRDESGDLLYVGIAVDPARRWQAHARREWWSLVAVAHVEWFPDRLSAHREERRAIIEERPRFNRDPGHVPLAIVAPRDTATDGDIEGGLAGAAEIELMLGVSRQRVQQLTSRHDFPRPIERLAMGAVWRRSDVEKWARATGRATKD